ncbi:MAG: helix-turn-helix domain-containing protein [Candidatus Paceibacterota bacterium]
MIGNMPHISQKEVDREVKEQLEKSLLNLLKDTGSQTRVHIFSELLTKTEQVMLAKRIGILLLLKKGLSPYKISQLLGVSPSTADRFAHTQDSGKYQRTTEWIWKQSKEGAIEKLFEKLASLAFTRRTKSFKKFVDEY